VTVFVESGLRFEFEAGTWPHVLQWDADATYTGALQHLRGRVRRKTKSCSTCSTNNEGTRAVDFAAIGPKGLAYLIEVKRLVGSGQFESVDERAFKIAAKVRDSLAGIAYARAQHGDIPDPALAPVRKTLKSTSNVKVIVVFDHPGQPTQILALEKRLKSLLRWLRGDLLVVSSAATVLPGLSICLD
jgi:hypothetical protein